LESSTLLQIKDAIETELVQYRHHHPESLLSSLEIEKNCPGKKVHPLNVPSFYVFLSQSIQHIEKLVLTEWLLKVFDVREGAMNVFPDFSSCVLVGFQTF
jgi:hypothetical protein